MAAPDSTAAVTTCWELFSGCTHRIFSSLLEALEAAVLMHRLQCIDDAVEKGRGAPPGNRRSRDGSWQGAS